MSNVAIRVGHLGKLYRIGKRERYRTLRDSITDALAAPFRRFRSPETANVNAGDTYLWALKDISFEVERGEVIGIIGRNGAGKSTLLKVLSRITEPTEGYVEIHGRVGSLLEVGTGFHPELTGRENIYLNGAILGMRRSEIVRKFDEIVAFAEVDKFIDTAVKHYSSGMYMRLAFAVAAHLEPEILIVDEVLAVGDAAFQKKCLGKMGEVAKEGRTVLFVTHNMVALRTLCRRAICLSAGQVSADEDANVVASNYLQSDLNTHDVLLWENPKPRLSGASVWPQRARLVPRTSNRLDCITLRTPIDIEVTFWNAIPSTVLNVSLVLHNLDDTCVFNTVSNPTRRPAGLIREVCEVPGDLLNDTTYRVRLLIVRDASNIVVDLPDVMSFEVVEDHRRIEWYGKWVGAVRPNLKWRSEVILDEPHACDIGVLR